MNVVVVGLVAAADASTAQASWDSGLALALAGGAGAFLGTVVAQVVQLRRDRWLAGRQDQRRREDVEREAMAARRAVRLTDYRNVLVFLHSFRSDLVGLDTSARFSDSVDDELVQGDWANLGTRWQELLAMRALVDIVGSAVLRDVFERLSRSSVQFIAAIPHRKIIEVPPDSAEETAGAGGEPAVRKLVTLTPEERTEVVLHRVSRTLALVDEARSIIREELDLHD